MDNVYDMWSETGIYSVIYVIYYFWVFYNDLGDNFNFIVDGTPRF